MPGWGNLIPEKGPKDVSSTPPPPADRPAGASLSSDDAQGTLGALFDFSFTTFVTPKIVRFVYVIGTVLIGLGVLVFIISGFASNVGLGVILLIVAPIVGLIYLAFFRMMLEMYYSIVRLSEDVHKRGGAL